VKLSVIICTYNREKFLPESLYSIAKQSINSNKFELIIVNNNSTDSTDSIVKIFIAENINIDIKYFIEKQQGLSFARNRGINESNGDILIFLDDDAIASSSYLEEVLNFFISYNDAAAMGGKILPKFETFKPKWASKYLMSVFSVINLGEKVKLFKNNAFPIGANMAVKKSIFNEVGNFNTDLGRRGANMEGGEEKDLFSRIRKNNGLIYYNPKPWVYHIIPENRTKLSFLKKQAYGIGYSERIRVDSPQVQQFWKRTFIELFKWAASFILFFYYLIIFQPQKSIVIIKFRWWISSGFFQKKMF